MGQQKRSSLYALSLLLIPVILFSSLSFYPGFAEVFFYKTAQNRETTEKVQRLVI
jgi:hypothetical protein